MDFNYALLLGHEGDGPPLHVITVNGHGLLGVELSSLETGHLATWLTQGPGDEGVEASIAALIAIYLVGNDAPAKLMKQRVELDSTLALEIRGYPMALAEKNFAGVVTVVGPDADRAPLGFLENLPHVKLQRCVTR